MGDLQGHHTVIKTLDQAYAPDRLPVPDDGAFLSAVRSKLLARWLIGAGALAIAMLVILIVVVVVQIRSVHPMTEPGEHEPQRSTDLDFPP